MKKFIFILLLSFSSLLGYSQILNEDFETAPDTPDASGVWTMASGNWLVKDNRTNTNPNWRNRVNPHDPNSGLKAAFIERQNLPGILAEEWLITPQVTLTAANQLRFFTKQTAAGDDGTAKYQVRVSSSSDPADLNAYTVLVEYSDSDLSTITALQTDYEEKVLNLPFTGARYFAFVRVVTQPGPATSGDRWLVDDVKIVERCLDPIGPTVETATITAKTVKMVWTAPNTTNFQVQYGPAGFTLDVPAPPLVVTSPVFSSTSTPLRSYLATDLQPNTDYQYYVRGVCANNVLSEWVGPFNWTTDPLGITCAEPIEIATVSYSDSSNTSIYGNNVTGSPGSTGCNAGTGFLGSNDVVYHYVAETTGNLVISMNPLGAANTGVFVYADTCSNIGNTCIAGLGNATSNIRILPTVPVTVGQNIFIVISSTTATASFNYQLNIQYSTSCVAPQGLTVAGTPIVDASGVTVIRTTSATSATLNWVNGPLSTSTSWEVAVQTAGSAIPNGAGTPTIDNTDYLVTTTLDGTPLQGSQTYQYWVRADCGGGVFSPWVGPVLFNTIGCEVNNQCTYTFTPSGTWQNGRMQVIQGGLVVATLGATLTAVQVTLCSGQPFDLFWNIAGDSPDLVRINVINNFNQTLYAMTTNSQTLIGTTLYSGPVDCFNPLCLKPTANPTVPAATIFFNTATVNWVSSGVPTTGWEIYVVPQGSPAPVNGGPTVGYIVSGPTPTYTFQLPAEALLPDTNYTVYVRSLCSVNGPSDWTGGTNFRTKEQCPKPTSLAAPAANITPFGAQLTWLNPSQTNWQIITQLASEPEPAANDPRWLLPANQSNGSGTTPFSYTVTGLTPETAYEFYIRTDCGGGILSNPAGPRPFTTKISCPKPTALAATATPFGGTFTWTATGSATSFQVIVLPAGSPAPSPTDVGIITDGGGPGDTSYTYTYNGVPLTPETNYVFYVRSDCGATDGLSTWAGPRPFLTTPTCFKPLTLTLGPVTAFTAELRWTNVPSTTAWQILALPAGSPAPNSSTLGWVPLTLADVTTTGVNAYSFVYGQGLTAVPPVAPLSAETSYVFYIRGDCGVPNGTSTWTGPRAATTTPSCYKPALASLTATNLTPFTAELGWTNNVNSPVNEWQILILPAGSTAPTTAQTGTVINQNPYPATGLTQNTCYDYYVRSSCGGINGVSTWTGPKNFCTPPTCPQPTNAIALNNLDPTSTLTWTGPSNTTQWELLIQAPSGPVPGANPAGTVPLTSNTYTTPELPPGFYEFYVRANCSDTDKSFWTGPINFFIAVPPAVCASIDIPFPTTSPGIIDLCPGESCIDLTGVFTESKDTTTYTVLPLAFAPPFPFTGGTQLNIGIDDTWGEVFTLPFNFCFYGVNYPNVQVGSNGVVSFDTPQPTGAGSCEWNTTPGQIIPDPAFPILNAIYGVYQDIDPSISTAPIVRSINYQVLGVAPCRAFVVNFYNIAQFSCGTSVGLQTSQIVLYETSNIIEVYVQDRTACAWNDGLGVIGIQNAAGTLAHFPPGRNLGNWEAQNEAWRFTPDGASNVEFSWLKDGALYSNNPTINVCVSATTTMTAKAVYTGCGGQITTKVKDVLLRITDLVIPPIQNVQACQSYTLPALTIGNYFTGANGTGSQLNAGDIITTDQTIYVYAATQSTPICTAEIQFIVDIVPILVAPAPETVTGCQSYTLPALTAPFNYFTGPLGTGIQYTGAGGDIISTPQQLYIYGVSGLCTAESTLDINIDTLTLAPQNSVSDCDSFILPALPANNTYYTATGGPNGTGTIVAPLTEITQTQTIYIYAQSGTCTDEGSFTVNIFGIDPPTVNVTQPNCQTLTGTIEVTSPLNPTTGGGVLPTNLFISQVTDQPSGSPSPSLSYVELFNGTGAAVDLSNYKLKVYTNGNPGANCDTSLSGIIANNTTAVIRIGNVAEPNQGGVSPDLTPASCTGVNSDDSIVLTTSADVEVDVWGINGTDFTPLNTAGYSYTRNTTATVPSTTWNAADWTITDWDATTPPDYSDVDNYPIVASNIYEYNIDGQPWQFTTTFANVAVGQHTITVREIATGCTNSLVVDIQPSFVNAPVTTFGYPTVLTTVCNNAANLTPDTSATGFATGGAYTANPNTLLINASTGEINVAGSPFGTYTVKYEVQPDLPNCISGGSSSATVIIDPIKVPDFAEFPAYCPGATVPSLPNFSPNGVAGVWSPTAIDPTPIGIQIITFTPNANQCASVRSYNVEILTPTIDPTFAPISDLCAGATADILPGASTDLISGSWSPQVIDNQNVGPNNYTFTPNPGQCALPKTITVTVNPVEVSDFADTVTFCAGTTAPVLETTAPNSIVGTWSPDTITQAGSYVFTPTPIADRCFSSQTITVTVGAAPVFEIIGGCINGDYTLTVTSQSDFTTATFVWKDNGGNIIPTATTNTLIVSQPGNYTVDVTYQGCSDSDVFPATTIACTIQKGISPRGTGDGDGLNDYFDLTGQNVTKLEIFNRYGSKVYTKSNYSKEWYGQSDNGDELPDGTYFYVIERSSEKSRTGWIYINHEL